MSNETSIRQAMAQLTPPHRDMIYRAHYLSQSVAQIAAELGVSSCVVRAELHEAMQHLLRLVTASGAPTCRAS